MNLLLNSYINFMNLYINLLLNSYYWSHIWITRINRFRFFKKVRKTSYFPDAASDSIFFVTFYFLPIRMIRVIYYLEIINKSFYWSIDSLILEIIIINNLDSIHWWMILKLIFKIFKIFIIYFRNLYFSESLDLGARFILRVKLKKIYAR
jgi:hypothetical protein